MHIETFQAALAVSIIAGGLLAALQDTDLIAHVINVFRRKNKFVSRDDFLSFIDVSHPVLSDFLRCPVCLGTWICVAVTIYFIITWRVVVIGDGIVVALMAMPGAVLVRGFISRSMS